MEYIIMFVATIFCFYIAFYNSNNKKINLIFYLLGILIPAIFAGMRSITIGTDTAGYLLTDFNRVLSGLNFIQSLSATNEEIGFFSVVYFFGKIFSNIHVVMFFIELIIMLFVSKFAKNQDSKRKSLGIIIIYLFLCFGESLCIMRQHISFAILLYSTLSLNQNKKVKTLILWLIAILFHNSAILYIIIYLILNIKNKFELKRQKIYYLIIILIIIFIGFSFKPILNFLINDVGLLPNRYNLYISSTFGYIKNPSYITSRLLFDILWIILYMYSYLKSENDEYKKLNLASLTLLIINLIFYILSRNYLILSRVSIYIFNTAILINPYFWEGIKNNSNKKKLIIVFVFSCMILANFFFTIIFNSDKSGGYHTYPYSLYTEDNL